MKLISGNLKKLVNQGCDSTIMIFCKERVAQNEQNGLKGLSAVRFS